MPYLDPVSGVLRKKAAAHLLRRLTFGASKTEIDLFSGKTATQAITDLFAPIAIPLPPKDLKTGLTWLPKPDPIIRAC